MKFVLVRSNLGTLYVLPRPDWDKYQAQAKHMGASGTELVAESNDRDELVRFRDLTKEET
jgi:hypothetical protein